MKRIKRFFLALLSFCLLQGLAAQEKSYRIGILLDANSTAIDSLVTEMKNEIKATVGEDAEVLFPKEIQLINKLDLQTAELQYNQLIKDDTDIILGLGVIIGDIIRRQKNHLKPTILLGGANRDMQLFDFDKETSGIPNFTYLLEQDSYKKDLQRLHKLTGFKKVGVLMEAEYLKVLPIAETFERISKEIGIDYKIIPLEKSQTLDKNLGAIDAVYLAGGFFLSEEALESLSKLFIEKRLPSFTLNNALQVKAGIMATRNPKDNFDNVIRRLAITVERYISGRPLEDLPILVDTQEGLLVNYNTADAIDLPVRYSMVSDTEFIGELTNANTQATYSLQNAIAQALGKNVALKSIEQNIALQEQEVKTAKNNYLPLVSANAAADFTDPDVADFGFGQTPERQTSGRIQLEQTLFSETVNANAAVQKHLRNAEQENYNAEELNTAFNVANAYFDILIGKANTEILRANVKTTQKNLMIAQQNFEAGISGQSDIFRFQSELAQNNQLMVEAFTQLEQRMIQLNQLLNNDVNAKIDIEEITLETSLLETLQYTDFNELLDNPVTREPFIAFLTKEALKNAPELKALEHTVKATERNIRLNGMGRFLPTIGVQAGYNSIFNRSGVGSSATDGFVLPDNTYNASVVVSIPIFNRNQTHTNRQTAKIQKEQLEFNKRDSELTIGANVNNSILNVINQMANMDLSKVSEEAAKRSLALTQTSYAEGATTMVQLIDAQRNYLNAQLTQKTAIYSYLLSVLQVERSIGYFFMMQPQEVNSAFIAKFLDTQNN
ncbi:TolC family protein [Flagellimonas sp. HMM57]|uniref:TolC family protein n=1 Tax=Flagellimonas sp. HMM57 TaxID=2905121 RepID=UPI001F35EED7|nr:TolC family protein [Flagellimonas sp. HMM57]UII74786.1 TolC family protein [Flagellimonas sp. HMM57]